MVLVGAAPDQNRCRFHTIIIIIIIILHTFSFFPLLLLLLLLLLMWLHFSSFYDRPILVSSVCIAKEMISGRLLSHILYGHHLAWSRCWNNKNQHQHFKCRDGMVDTASNPIHDLCRTHGFAQPLSLNYMMVVAKFKIQHRAYWILYAVWYLQLEQTYWMWNNHG